MQIIKKLLIALFVIFVLAIKSQNSIGLGAGFDWVEGFDTYPVYSDKDINLNFSHSQKHLIFEARQGFRYLEGINTMRYNTYALVGFTTQRKKFFVFDLVIGGAFSGAIQNKAYENFQYPNQFCPTIKTSLNFRLSSKKRLYLGMDWLISTYKYFHGDKWGDRVSEGGITGSVLLSLNYVLQKKPDREKK